MRNSSLSCFTSLAGLVCMLIATSSTSHAVQYNIVDLGTLGGTTSVGNGINASGEIVGSSKTAGDNMTHAFRYSNGVMTDLGTLGGINSFGLAINASGVVVGTSNPVNIGTHAFRESGGGMIDLGALATGTNSRATAINASGQVAGWSTLMGSSAIFHAFVDNGGGLIDLHPPLITTHSQAFGINDSGDITGQMAGNSTAFVLSGGVVTSLGTGGADVSSGLAINASGQVAGVLSFNIGGPSPFLSHAFLYSGGITDLGTLGGTESFSWALNTSGQVVGAADTTNNVARHAFLYSGGVMTDLNDLISPISGWTLVSANGINDSGQITGAGLIGGVQHAYLLTPVPEPGTLALALTAAGLLVVRPSRKVFLGT